VEFFVRKHFRAALLTALAMLSLQPAALFVPRLYAGAVPAAGSPAKKKVKSKKTKKQKILKGHHEKHKRRPA